MRRPLGWLFLLIALLLPVKAENTNAVARPTLESFQIISQRNIFNPNRSARSSRSESTEAAPKPARTESFGLIGTMIYEKGSFAFFDGSSSDYKKVAEPSQKIAGFVVKEVSPSAVKLENDGHTVELTVGQQMKRQEEGEWKLSAAPESFATQSATGSSNQAGAKAAPGDDEEILKKLLQKREAELNK